MDTATNNYQGTGLKPSQRFKWNLYIHTGIRPRLRRKLIRQSLRGMIDQPVLTGYMALVAKRRMARYSMKQNILLRVLVLFGSAVGLSFVIWISVSLQYVATGEISSVLTGSLILALLPLGLWLILIGGLLKSDGN